MQKPKLQTGYYKRVTSVQWKTKLVQGDIFFQNKMSHIENLKAFDPFADAAKGDDEAVQDGLVHVRLDN